MKPIKTILHPRNPHRDLYDFKKLITACPDLAQFVSLNPYGNESIDFANPLAVKTLNQAILKLFYEIKWDIQAGYLCPPIPGRADYIHYLADLMGSKKPIRVLDIGTGANCIYPLIGHKSYGWKFVATDIDPKSIMIAKQNVQENGLDDAIEIRLQPSKKSIFEGVIGKDEIFDVSMCNPPFHSSAEEARAGTMRKNKNLKTKGLNFGGRSNELWCEGGEVAFISQMIKESVDINCKWFTTLVSKESSLPKIYKALEKTRPAEIKTIDMGQGQKKSRIVAWTHQPKAK